MLEVDDSYPPGYYVDYASARVVEVKSKVYKLAGEGGE